LGGGNGIPTNVQASYHSDNGKGRAIPVQGWAEPEGSRRLRLTEPEGSRRLRLPDFQTLFGRGEWNSYKCSGKLPLRQR